MKETDLRIGNWLNGPEGNAQVTGIQNREVVEIGEIGHVMEDVSPIPLTEEWLVKFGFKPKRISGGYHYFIQLRKHFKIWARYSYSVQGAWTIHLPYNYPEPDRQYVHQLQNLYFALTGEELEIK